MASWDAQKMLDKYLHDYFVKKGCLRTAEVFAMEANVADSKNVAIDTPGGFLKEWWDIFYEKYRSHQDQRAQDPNEAAQDIDNLAYHIPSAVPASSPHSAKPVNNMMSLMDCSGLSQRVPFVIDPSCLMEQSPKMPQQSEARDEGEGCDIHFEKTTQMEPNADAPERATLPVPDPFEAGAGWLSISFIKLSYLCHPVQKPIQCGILSLKSINLHHFSSKFLCTARRKRE